MKRSGIKRAGWILALALMSACATAPVKEAFLMDVNLDEAIAAQKNPDCRKLLEDFRAAFKASDSFAVSEQAAGFEIHVFHASFTNPAGARFTGGAESYWLDKATGKREMQWHEHPMRCRDEDIVIEEKP